MLLLSEVNSIHLYLPKYLEEQRVLDDESTKASRTVISVTAMTVCDTYQHRLYLQREHEIPQ